MKGLQWMRSRVVRLVVAGLLAFPMGAPSVFAVAQWDDTLRPRQSSGRETHRAVREEIDQPDTRTGQTGEGEAVATVAYQEELAAYEGLDRLERELVINPISQNPQVRAILAQFRRGGYSTATDAKQRAKENRETAFAELDGFYHGHHQPGQGRHISTETLNADLDQAAKPIPSRFERSLTEALDERKTDQGRSFVTVMHANLGKVLGNPDILPEDAVEAARSVLDEAKANGLIKDNMVIRNGDDLIVVASHNRGGENPVIELLVTRAIVEALEASSDSPRVKRLAEQPWNRIQQELEFRPLEFPYKERGSDPMFLIITQNTAEGALNEAAWDLAVVNPSQGRVEAVPGYRLVMSDVHQQRQGKRTRRDFVFDTANGGGHAINAAFGLAAAPEGWAIREVHPADFEGRRAPDEPLLIMSGERIGGGKSYNNSIVARAQSGYQAVGEVLERYTKAKYVPGGKNNEHLIPMRPMTLDEIAHRLPADQAGVAIIEWQSYEDGKIRPIRDGVKASGFAQRGREMDEKLYDPLRIFPEIQEFDPFTLVDTAQARAQGVVDTQPDRFIDLPEPGKRGYRSNIITKLLDRANKAAKFTASKFKIDVGGEPGHQEPPYLYVPTLRAGIKEGLEQGLILDGRAYATGDDVQMKFQHVRGVNDEQIHNFSWYNFVRTGWFVMVLGRKPYGHYQDLPIFKENMNRAQLFAAGTRESNINDRFIELLKEELLELKATQEALGMSLEEREPVDDDIQILDAWYAQYKAGKVLFDGEVSPTGEVIFHGDTEAPTATLTYQGPPSGNVTGQGIGFAELPITEDTKEITDWALDKAGPGGFNWPLYMAIYYWKYFEPLYRDYEQIVKGARGEGPIGAQLNWARWFEEFKPKLKAIEAAIASKGVDAILEEAADQPFIFEIWDTRNKKAIFLDAQTERETIRSLLVAENWFSTRRIWLKTKDGWDSANPQRYLSEVPLADFSTERLSEVTGGQYVGKDDPAAVLVRDLGKRITFFQTFYAYLLQGDERGSHNGDPTPGSVFSPEASRRPSPTVRSYPVQSAVEYELNEDGTYAKVVDVYENPVFEERRDLSVSVNKNILAHNEFPPQGVSPGKTDVPGAVSVDVQVLPTEAEGQLPTVRLALWKGEEPAREVSKEREDSRTLADELVSAIKNEFPEVSVRRYTVTNPDGKAAEVGVELTTKRAIGKDRAVAVAEELRIRYGGYHGKVESAYPLAAAVAKTISQGSPYEFARDVTITNSVAQAQWAEQFEAIEHRLSGGAVRQAGDPTRTKVVLLDLEILQEGPDLAIAVERYFKQLATYFKVSSLEEVATKAGVKLVLNDPRDVTAEQAEARVTKLIKAVNDATKGAVNLKREYFAAVVPGTNAEQVAQQVQEKIGAPISLVIGPKEWTEQYRAVPSLTDTMLAVVFDVTAPDGTTVNSGAAAFFAGIEAMAAEGQLDPVVVEDLQTEFNVSITGLTIVPDALDVLADVEQELLTYRQTVSKA